MAIARRLKPFGVSRLLYSGRAAKAHAAELNGEFGKKREISYTFDNFSVEEEEAYGCQRSSRDIYKSVFRRISKLMYA